VRPAGYQPLGLQPLTCKGEIAHEADGTTFGRGAQPSPNLSSPECPTRGLPQGGKPTDQSKASTSGETMPRRRKAKRISESKPHGTVTFNPVALLTRGGESPRVVGPSMWVVHGDCQSRRSFKRNPSLSRVEPLELGHVVRRSAVDNHREVPIRPTVPGGRTGRWRAIKDSGPSQGPG
jgi:hypothetical protein